MCLPGTSTSIGVSVKIRHVIIAFRTALLAFGATSAFANTGPGGVVRACIRKDGTVRVFDGPDVPRRRAVITAGSSRLVHVTWQRARPDHRARQAPPARRGPTGARAPPVRRDGRCRRFQGATGPWRRRGYRRCRHDRNTGATGARGRDRRPRARGAVLRVIRVLPARQVPQGETGAAGALARGC